MNLNLLNAIGCFYKKIDESYYDMLLLLPGARLLLMVQIWRWIQM